MNEKSNTVKTDNSIVLGGIYDNRAERYVHIGAYTNENALARALVAIVAFSPDKTLSEFQSDYAIHKLAFIVPADGTITPCFENYGRVDVIRKKIEGTNND